MIDAKLQNIVIVRFFYKFVGRWKYIFMRLEQMEDYILLKRDLRKCKTLVFFELFSFKSCLK